jgi:chromosome segregation ATPase
METHLQSYLQRAEDGMSEVQRQLQQRDAELQILTEQASMLAQAVDSKSAALALSAAEVQQLRSDLSAARATVHATEAKNAQLLADKSAQ